MLACKRRVGPAVTRVTLLTFWSMRTPAPPKARPLCTENTDNDDDNDRCGWFYFRCCCFFIISRLVCVCGIERVPLKRQTDCANAKSKMGRGQVARVVFWGRREGGLRVGETPPTPTVQQQRYDNAKNAKQHTAPAAQLKRARARGPPPQPGCGGVVVCKGRETRRRARVCGLSLLARCVFFGQMGGGDVGRWTWMGRGKKEERAREEGRVLCFCVCVCCCCKRESQRGRGIVCGQRTFATLYVMVWSGGGGVKGGGAGGSVQGKRLQKGSCVHISGPKKEGGWGEGQIWEEGAEVGEVF
jgi:hypothetical protein